MAQKIIQPFLLKPQEIYPGIIIRRDEVIVTDVKFSFNYSILYSHYITRISSCLSSLSFQEIRKLKALCGIHTSVDIDDTAKMISKIICNDIFGIVNVLTEKNTTYSLSEYILADVEALPKLTYDIVCFINSHKISTLIEGSGTSVIKWRNIERSFDSSELASSPEKYTEYSILVKTRRLVEIFKELGFEEIIKLNSLSDLFNKSEFVLNGSVSSTGEDSISLEVGDDFNKEDLFMYLICNPNYTFSDRSFIQYNVISLSKTQVRHILRMPIHLLTDSNINFTSNDRLVNMYLESSTINGANIKVSYDGFKSKNLPFNSKRSSTSSFINSRKNKTDTDKGVDDTITKT